MKLLRLTLLTAAALSFSTAASAQAPYVGASLFADIVRSTHVETSGVGGDAGGEAIGFSLRVGTRVGSIWGVEAEFARPAEIEDEGGGPIALPALDSLRILPAGLSPAIFPPIAIAVRSVQRHSTLSAVAWAEQQLTARVALVYLGGIAFARSQRGYTYSYSPLAGLSVVPPFGTETVIYGVGPVVGFESRLTLTDRAQLVPGIRLHALDNTWLVRPSVGISWSF